LRLLARKGETTACDCVLRNIFRVCYNRFRYYTLKEKYLRKVSLEIHSGPNRRGTWGRKEEEYLADFISVSRHALDPAEYRIFKFRFLLGADWKLACRQLKMERGTFFHLVYRIEQKLGKAFAELEPYSLYPLQDYFHTPIRRQPVKALPAQPVSVIPIRPPVRISPEQDGELQAA
jgi:hypothetical protein